MGDTYKCGDGSIAGWQMSCYPSTTLIFNLLLHLVLETVDSNPIHKNSSRLYRLPWPHTRSGQGDACQFVQEALGRQVAAQPGKSEAGMGLAMP